MEKYDPATICNLIGQSLKGGLNMVMTLSVAERLGKAISDYLLWMISNGYADSTCMQYQRILKYFFVFIKQKAICWEDIFTFNTLNDSSTLIKIEPLLLT